MQSCTTSIETHPPCLRNLTEIHRRFGSESQSTDQTGSIVSLPLAGAIADGGIWRISITADRRNTYSKLVIEDSGLMLIFFVTCGNFMGVLRHLK